MFAFVLELKTRGLATAHYASSLRSVISKHRVGGGNAADAAAAAAAVITDSVQRAVVRSDCTTNPSRQTSPCMPQNPHTTVSK